MTIRYRVRVSLLFAAVMISAAGCKKSSEAGSATALENGESTNNTSEPAEKAVPHLLLEGYPVPVAQSIAQESAATNTAANAFGDEHAYVLMRTAYHWVPGATVRVAFLGGNDELYKKIEDAAHEWTKPGFANLNLSFHDATGSYRHWSPKDKTFAAEIRVAFMTGDDGGYWSLVGNQSIDTHLKGGSPGDVSLNLGGFDKGLPADWHAVVLHEFGHALGFQHEHQSPVAGCDFRFDDDPGYQKTTDAEGWYTLDPHGKRPGLITYLGGYSNYWKPDKVKFNLAAMKPSSAFSVGAFDSHSIMMYYFDPFMFVKGSASKCFIGQENVALSAQDQLGVHTAYPSSDVGVSDVSSVKSLRNLKLSDKATPELRARLTAKISRLNKMVKP